MFSTPSCNYLLGSKVFYPYVDQTGEVVAEVAWQKPEPVWLRFNPDKKSPSFRVRIYINDTLLDLRKHALVKWANTQQWLVRVKYGKLKTIF